MTYSACCGRVHAGDSPDTAEQLMRSRYSAYGLGLRDNLLATWHPSTRPIDRSRPRGDVKNSLAVVEDYGYDGGRTRGYAGYGGLRGVLHVR